MLPSVFDGNMNAERGFPVREWAGYYYNARWYDAKLGRFAQADTISGGGMNGEDRYSYVKNSPNKYIDPSGHSTCDIQYGPAAESCREAEKTNKQKRDDYLAELAMFGITLNGDMSSWTLLRIKAVLDAVRRVGDKLMNTYKKVGWKNSAEAFKAVFQYINMTWGREGANPACGEFGYGYTYGAHQIKFMGMSGEAKGYPELMRKNIIHELGHAYANGMILPYTQPGFIRGHIFRPNKGYVDFQQNTSTDPSEVFADMFLAWVYDAWSVDQKIRIGSSRCKRIHGRIRDEKSTPLYCP